MAKIAMLIELDKCVGCFACQSACKIVNSLPNGVNWLKVTPAKAQPEVVDGQLFMDRFPVPVSLEKCAICPDRQNGQQPLCSTVCMGKALFVGAVDEMQKLGADKRTVIFAL